ncbi:hypothetical protein V8F33_005829 [Rhypophila sp. PSN 637]
MLKISRLLVTADDLTRRCDTDVEHQGKFPGCGFHVHFRPDKPQDISEYKKKKGRRDYCVFLSQCTEEEIERCRKYDLRCHFRRINTDKLDDLARYTALKNSWETLQYHMETTKDLSTRIDKFHRGLRLCLNSLCRPFLRKLTILDLPNELLLEIFEWVEDFNINYRDTSRRLERRNPRDINDIRNCRLVCRRFNAVSSQLLVRIVRVALTERSLTRFEEISRHPVISKGVVDAQSLSTYTVSGLRISSTLPHSSKTVFKKPTKFIKQEREILSTVGISLKKTMMRCCQMPALLPTCCIESADMAPTQPLFCKKATTEISLVSGPFMSNTQACSKTNGC